MPHYQNKSHQVLRFEDYKLKKACRGSREAPYSETSGDVINNGHSFEKMISISAMHHYQNKSHEELRLEDSELQKGFNMSTKPWGVTKTEYRGSREAPYSETPGDAINSGHSIGKMISISAMPHYQNKSHEELRFQDYELHKGFNISTECRGSREAPYSETPGDGINSGHSPGKFISISAMPHYQNKSHEELRFQDYELHKGFNISTKPWGVTGTACRGSTEAPYSETPGDGIDKGHSSGKMISISAMHHYQNKSHEELRFHDYELKKECRRSREAPYSETPGDGIDKGHSSGKFISISAMPHYQNKSHEELRFQDYELHKGFNISTKPWGVTGIECRGSREAPYSETPGDGINKGHSSGKIISISGMPCYQNRSHEELRLEDSVLQKGTAGRGSREAPYSETPEGDGINRWCSPGEIVSISAMPHYQNRSHEELRFEDSELQKGFFHISTKPWAVTGIECRGSGEVPYSKTPEGDGINTGNSELQKGSSFPLQYPFKESSCLSHPLTSPVPSSQPSFDSLRGTTFGTSTAAYVKPTVGSTSMGFDPLPFGGSSAVGSVGRDPRTCAFGTSSTNVSSATNNSTLGLLITSSTLSDTSNNSVSNNFGFGHGSTSDSASSSIFGSQTSSGSVVTTETKNEESRQGFSATEVVPRENERDVSKIQSISAMAIYEHKSHEELRSEDYGLCNACYKEPSIIASSFMKSTPVTSSDPCSSFMNASQPQQTADKVGPISTNDPNTPSQASSGLPIVTEFTSQNINGPHYTPSSNSLMQSVTSILHGIPTQEPNGRSSETKLQVMFCIDEEANGSVAPSLPRKKPRAWVNITSLSLHMAQGSKGDEVKDSCSSVQIMEINEDMHALLNLHEVEVAATTERRNADVLALLPKLPDGVEYYTEPSLRELAAKEMAEAGFCRRVKDFVVGRQGHGSIKFLGETDVCHLDVESIVQLNNRQVIIYPNGRKKPRDGGQVNKTAEVTMLNVKCISKKTGKKYVEGPQVESYKEILVKTVRERGAEFDSYDPVEGELKLRVKLF
ncbi:nuclear pore complex protein NUP98B-like isoform X2 [Salvia hispanica]|uniref:nuclear pore complex protein NUP98B-like isoform X2 n=1 Tax=Salvia hispanica TaxID=49212 RepID=UPI002009C04E|nr:nuclear pore complex protein NUP98B-like isoform X2 [Salvia hispanica]